MEISERFRSLFTYRYFVRDTQSLKYCKQIGVKKALLCPDLSWCYDYERDVKKQRNQAVCLMLNFKGYTYGVDSKQYRELLLKQIAAVLHALEENMGQKIKILVCYQVEQDKDFAEMLYGTFHQEYECQIIDHRLRLKELQAYYGDCQFHLSNRMHSLLVGYKYGSLPIGILDVHNHEKIVSAFQDNGLDDLLIDIYSEGYREQIDAILANADVLYAKLLEKEKENTLEIRRVLDSVMAG